MIWNAFILALREIRRNVLRSFLTILGIVIGVAAVIIMVTLGEGATLQVSQQIASLGSNLLTIRPGQSIGFGGATAPPFKMEDVAALRQIHAVEAATPYSSKAITAIYGNANMLTSVAGIDNDFFRVRDWKMVSGRQFTDSELRAGKAVCILGESVRKKLFNQQQALASQIRLQKLSCEVIGILEAKGQSAFGMDQDDLILLPLRSYQRRIAGNLDVNRIQLSVNDGMDISRVQKDIERLLRERRRLSSNEEDDFTIRDAREITAMLTGTTQVLTTLLSAVAAVSLLVGGIGIMNIMLVSVTERTREIGIRLAIGALEREVLLQFLVEAIVLSSFGGITGIVFALVASRIIADMIMVPFVFNLGIILLAFLFSAMVGVVFGFFPARKAARLDPIEALRHE